MTNELHLPTFKLAYGAHTHRSKGVCFMEAVAWWAGERHTDRPQCVDPMIARYGIGLNDGFKDDERQLLVPLIPFAAGTATADEQIIKERKMILRRAAVDCARLVLPIFEAAQPGDLRVRECIEATEAHLADPSEANLETLWAKRAADAAAAAYAAAAYAAAAAAADAAVYAAVYAATAAAYAAAAAAAAELRSEIVNIAVEALKQCCLVGLSVEQIANLPTLVFEAAAPEQFEVPGAKALELIR